MTGSVAVAAGWLVVAVLGLIAWVISDIRQYRAFKAATVSAVRQRFYLSWAVQGFILLGCGSVITAMVLGRDLQFHTLPPEFEQLAALFRPPKPVNANGGSRIGLIIGFLLGLAIAVSIQVWRMRRALKVVLGDVDAMIPRNWRERLAVLPLCLNAGFSEELFFRMALPLLVASVTGSVLTGFVVSAIIFGLIHAYQGWKGVVATTFLGVILTLVYLKSGSLVRPIVLHVLLDVVGLIVRPALAARVARRRRLAPDACGTA